MQTVINSYLILAVTFILIVLIGYTMIKLLNPVKKDSKIVRVVHCEDDYYINYNTLSTNNMEDNIIQLLQFSNKLQKENKELSDRIKHLENLKKMRDILRNYTVIKTPSETGNGSTHEGSQRSLRSNA